ncbi:MAG: hypothetical protein EXS63_05370 [Candidatus Omnitrophica bacterium]|nr:hypothetical protein [Candidatus Omnitrophota bacterium]
MKNKIKEVMGQTVALCFLAGFLGAFPLLSSSVIAFADLNEGVTGCNAVAVDPAASQEDQQVICAHAETISTSSCAMANHGTCSSPKTDDTLTNGTHCVCLGEMAASE